MRRGRQRRGKLALVAALLPVRAIVPESAWGDTLPQAPVERTLRSGLVIKLPEDIKGRSGFSLDPIEAEIVFGRISSPKAGDRVMFPGGQVESWRDLRSGPMGWFEQDALEGGYVRFSVPSARKDVMILEAMGDDMVFVNGVPRAGNQYGLQDEYQPWEPRFDYSLLPVALEPGRNDFLFKCYRGRLKVVLRRPRSDALLNARDLTLPDLIVGQRTDTWGAIVVINATTAPLGSAVLTVEPAMEDSESSPSGAATKGVKAATKGMKATATGAKASRTETTATTGATATTRTVEGTTAASGATATRTTATTTGATAARTGTTAATGATAATTRTTTATTTPVRLDGGPYVEGHVSRTVTPLPVIPPLSIRKVAFRLQGPAPTGAGELRVVLEVRVLKERTDPSAIGLEPAEGEGEVPETAETGEAVVGRIRRAEEYWASRSQRFGPDGRNARGKAPPDTDLLDSATITLKIVKPGEPYKRTFVSGVDGSLQYYAVNPAAGRDPGERVSLFLSLHGAAVEAINQAKAYAAKSWGAILAPTGRRPYGYNWEDWGRLDALEVLALAKKELNIDPDRVYLTGHSMGGHGTWHLGETFPDQFAAIGPSAGWLSFWSYRSRKEPDATTPIGRILRRATSPSDTLALARNLQGEGVYVLHGSEDDNVPVTESRRMVERLGAFHKDLVYHEQPGAGHWWDLSDDPGADCVDWAPLFDFFARRARPGKERVRQIDFMTANPGVSASCYWLGIEAQHEPLTISGASVRCDPAERRFIGTTTNVSRLALDVAHLTSEGAVTVRLDGQEIAGIPRPAEHGTIWLSHEGRRWSWLPRPPAASKGPQRYGPFKDAFRNRFVLVFGTKGSKEENAWAFAKARYDAERFWYQGNGSADVVPDVAYLPASEPDRNVILYGNAKTNTAWKALLSESPVQVDGAGARIGGRTIIGKDLACLFIRPRPGSDTASVGVVAGTGLAGMRLTNTKLYLEPGYPFPDLILFGASRAAKDGEGILAAGYFGLDWSVASGDFAWAEGLRGW